MDFSHEQEQHKALHDFLEKYLASIQEVKKDTSKFNALEMRQFMEGSKAVMVRSRPSTTTTKHSPLTTCSFACLM